MTMKNLDAKTQKALKEEKELLAKTKQSDSIINADLDNKSIMNELVNLTVNNPNETKQAVNVFKFDSLIDNYNKLEEEEKKKKEKAIRRKARKSISIAVDSILFNFKEKNKEELKQSIKSFNTNYKKFYLLNDYSIKSIARNSSDNDRLIKLTLALQVIKNNK